MLRDIDYLKSYESALKFAVLSSLGSQFHEFELAQQTSALKKQRFDFLLPSEFALLFGSSMGSPSPWWRSAPPPSVALVDVKSEFAELARKWKSERSASSSTSDIVMHPAYQRIISLGVDVVPMILRELQSELDHWFWALSVITGENPIPVEHRGKISKMATDWLEWGRMKGYV
jgi:hypothetical protein